jgi:hypothetical protein
MIMIVEVISSSCVQFLIRREIESRKKKPQMKESRDKNKSQRMNDFRVK